MSDSPYVRRATTPVLVAVALTSGAIVLLGDHFDSASGYVLAKPVRTEEGMAACVAEESMRLINADREQCHRDEVTLIEAPERRSAAGEIRCPPLR